MSVARNIVDVLFTFVEKRHSDSFREQSIQADDLLRVDCLAYFQNMMIVDLSDPYTFTDATGNIMKYKIIYNPFIVLLTGNAIAVNSGTINDVTVIIVDNNFLNLPVKYQNAIVAHEMGHRILKHNGKIRNKNQEFAADAYAAGVVGNQVMKKALGSIMYIVTKHSDPLSKFISRKELRERIERLNVE